MFITFNRTEVSFFKQVNKQVWKKNFPNFFYTLYKARRKSESSYSYSFLAVSNEINFFIDYLNRFVLKKKNAYALLLLVFFYRVSYMQIYPLNACKLN